MVSEMGLEPTRIAPYAPETHVSTIPPLRHFNKFIIVQKLQNVNYPTTCFFYQVGYNVFKIRSLFMKIVYFDVENYEENFLKMNNDNKYMYFLEPKPLNDMTPIKDEYKDADIISVFTTSRVNKTVLEQFKNLKLIALRSVGFNHIDIDYCKEHNIAVVNSPNYGNITVAEFALALLLDVCRRLTISYTEYKAGNICPENLIGTELHGKTIGIVGLGAIGSAFAAIAHGLNMKILAYDIVQKEELKQKYDVQYVDFEILLKNSDFISIHAPLTKENYHMFDEDSFKKMKPTAILINTGRGELIDTKALYEALMTKQIAGAGLDVLEKEETISDLDYIIGLNRLDKFTLERTIINSQLFKLPNVIITPHTAYNSIEAIRRILNTTMDNINKFASGNLQNQII